MSEFERLVVILQSLSDQAKSSPTSLANVVSQLDEAAFTFLAIILVLPFIQPIPLGPFTIAVGLVFILLGWQLLQGATFPLLPNKVSKIILPPKTWSSIVGVCIKFVGFFRKITKARHQYLVQGISGQKLKGMIFLAGGILLTAPFPIPLPFNNTLPALAILFACIADLEKDGLMVYVSVFLLLITSTLFGAYFFSLWFLGSKAINLLSLN